jgi:histone H2A
MAGVLEYLTFEILELASNKAGESSTGKKAAKNILPRHIMLAIRSDEEFSRFLKGAEFAQAGRLPTYLDDGNKKKKKKSAMEDDDDDAEFEEADMDLDDD